MGPNDLNKLLRKSRYADIAQATYMALRERPLGPILADAHRDRPMGIRRELAPKYRISRYIPTVGFAEPL